MLIYLVGGKNPIPDFPGWAGKNSGFTKEYCPFEPVLVQQSIFLNLIFPVFFNDRSNNIFSKIRVEPDEPDFFL